MNPADYGLDDSTLETVEAVGAANSPEPKRKGPRPTTLDAAKAALDAGQPIPFVRIGSAQNPAALDKAWKLWGFYAGTDYEALKAWSMNGNNTYAKLLRSYQAILMASTAAGIEPPGDMINDLQTSWAAEQAAKAEAKKAARAAKAAEKGTAQAKTKAKASGYDFTAVSTDDLTAQASDLEKLISDERRTAEKSVTDERRARAKAMRAELSSRLTPEDRAANAAATKALAKAVSKPKPKAGDDALIGRGQKPPVDGAKLAPPPPPKAPKAPAKPKAAPKAAKSPAASEAAPKIEVYKSLAGAREAAKKALGDDVVEGVDYKITGKGKRLSWIPIGVNAPKA